MFLQPVDQSNSPWPNFQATGVLRGRASRCPAALRHSSTAQPSLATKERSFPTGSMRGGAVAYREQAAGAHTMRQACSCEIIFGGQPSFRRASPGNMSVEGPCNTAVLQSHHGFTCGWQCVAIRKNLSIITKGDPGSPYPIEYAMNRGGRFLRWTLSRITLLAFALATASLKSDMPVTSLESTSTMTSPR